MSYTKTPHVVFYRSRFRLNLLLRVAIQKDTASIAHLKKIKKKLFVFNFYVHLNINNLNINNLNINNLNINIMKKIKFIYLCSIIALGFYSCSSDEGTENTQNLNLTKSISFSPKLNFDKPVTFKRSEVNVDSLLNNVVSELYSLDINSSTSKKEISSDKNLENYDGVDIKIGKELIEITPIYGTNPPLETSDDNADCGGKAGDGWQKFATCRSEDCVKKETEVAAKKLENTLSSGKCLDIRIKRNTLSATVCARVVSC